MSGSDITPPSVPRGVTYRGLTEIVGLGIAAVIVGAVIVTNLVRNIVVPNGLYDALIIIVGVIVARSAKGAQDRDAAATNIDAAAHAATKVADEVRATIEEHKAQISAVATLLAHVAPSIAPALQQMGAITAPPPAATTTVNVNTAPPAEKPGG